MEIIQQLKIGNESVFKDIFEEYHEKLYFFVLSKTSSAYLAEETTQLAFIKLWRYKENLNENLSISVQLFRIAKTTLIDLLRKQTYSLGRLSDITTFNASKEFNIANPVEEKIACNEMKQLISGMINKLPPVCKKVFEMHRFDDKTYNEIATELSVSVKTVEMHISRALKQLRTVLPSLFILFSVIKEILK